uniref:Uncharacterized protein n=1 Tax=Arundo donax TaxID=35708 RepID=A0A0A9FA33_ARUDO
MHGARHLSLVPCFVSCVDAASCSRKI